MYIFLKAKVKKCQRFEITQHTTIHTGNVEASLPKSKENIAGCLKSPSLYNLFLWRLQKIMELPVTMMYD